MFLDDYTCMSVNAHRGKSPSWVLEQRAPALTLERQFNDFPDTTTRAIIKEVYERTTCVVIPDVSERYFAYPTSTWSV